MSSDKDFFRRLFESPPEIDPDEVNRKKFDIEHFSEWLGKDEVEEEKPKKKKKKSN